MAEQWVKLLAHWKNCEVFSNIGCTGDTDLIIVHPELGPLRIDVKCSSWSQKKEGQYGWIRKGSHVTAPNVTAVEVCPTGDVSQWTVRWRNLTRGRNALLNPKWDCPPGWENFWDNDNRIYSTTSTKPTYETT